MTIVDASKLADGRVGVGFSDPCVALYAGTGAPGTHTDGRILARGVDIELNVETPDDNDFYADDVLAESESDQFSAGDLNLTLDGLHPAAERFIAGIPDPETVTVNGVAIPLTRTGGTSRAPYVGFGFIRVYKSNSIEIFVPMVYPRVKFSQPGLTAKTRENVTDWQTQSLTASVYRIEDDSADWRWVGGDYTTRSDARAALHALLAVAAEEA